jgi:NADH:ubiquinone oxidoreductase subunit 4 (subunit M)
MFNQIDFKKIVAYSTVFEMNIILFNFFFFNYSLNIFILYFCILHTSLSGVFFFFNDILYKRYNTRSVYQINGILNNFFFLPILLLVSLLNLNGLPLTLKFNLELFFLIRLFNFDFFFFFFFIIIQYLFILFINKIIFNCIFGYNNKIICSDLSFFELFIIIIFILPLLLL